MEKLKSKNSYQTQLEKDYQDNLKDGDFKDLVTKLKIDKSLGIVNNSSLNDCVLESRNCQNCKGLYDCQNKVLGHYLYPKKVGDILDFGYIPCKYKIKQDKALREKKTEATELLEASFKNIDVRDKNRVQVIKWLKEFYDNYDIGSNMKGLYLHGSFGSGKTYLIYALLNELKRNKGVNFEAIYYPLVLKTLRDDWDTYGDNVEYYSNVDILLLDDIGAEQVSEWGRDEVLGTILQNRMNKHLPTFFTSNLTILELEEHLALAKNSLDKVKARRIIERIKQLTIDMEIISNNKRN